MTKKHGQSLIGGVVLLIVLVGAFGVFLFGRDLSGDSSWKNADSACTGNDTPIELVRVSAEKSEPFVFQGRPIPDDWPDHKKYINSIERFPDVRSCLHASEVANEKPNVTRFAWDKIHSTQDAEVCMFRVFASIGNSDGAERWLKSQGFQSVQSHIISGLVMRLSGEAGDERPGTSVVASWPIETCSIRFKESLLNEIANRLAEKFPFLAQVGILKPYSLSVGVDFTADMVVDTVKVVYNVL